MKVECAQNAQKLQGRNWYLSACSVSVRGYALVPILTKKIYTFPRGSILQSASETFKSGLLHRHPVKRIGKTFIGEDFLTIFRAEFYGNSEKIWISMPLGPSISHVLGVSCCLQNFWIEKYTNINEEQMNLLQIQNLLVFLRMESPETFGHVASFLDISLPLWFQEWL